MDSLNASPGIESRKRKPFPIEGSPQMLKDFLNDDFSSCSSNGFSSFPRRACFTTVRNLVQMDLNSRDSDNAEKLLRSRFKVASKTISAFHKASAVVIKVIKYLPFSSIKAPTEPHNRTKQGILSRSLSRSLRQNFWKKRDKVENYDIKVRVMVKDIIRWKSFGDLIEEKQQKPPDICSSPLQISSIAATAVADDGTTATTSISSNNSNSWTDCDFTSEYLQSSGGSSEYLDENEGEEGKECSVEEKMTSNKGHNAVGADSLETTTYSVDPKGECPLEEKEQFSPVLVLDFPDEEEDDDGDGYTESAFHQSLASIERRKEKLLQKIRRFESLAELEPVDLEKRIALSEKDDSGESPCDDGVLLSQEDEDEVDLEAKMAGKGTTEGNGSACKEVVKMARDWVNGNSCGGLGLELEYNRETYVREMENGGGSWRKFEEEQREVAVEVESGVLCSLVDELLIDLFS
ncbi:uncharacterized protein LOC122082706 [Macadamia integrifolia]|uniref:uncharacterized protein LOC122082706 n=1 Tax=Macadamia integrifolia TaxID=60698 RepID=UPI001C4FADAF|nr:uncharacterized protein LOC122082706 [Macadamia integrifolia]